MLLWGLNVAYIMSSVMHLFLNSHTKIDLLLTDPESWLHFVVKSCIFLLLKVFQGLDKIILV